MSEVEKKRNKSVHQAVVAISFAIPFIIFFGILFYSYLQTSKEPIDYSPPPLSKEEKAVKDCHLRATQDSGEKLAKDTLRDPNRTTEEKEAAQTALDAGVFWKYNKDDYEYYYKTCLRSKGIDK